MWVCIVCFSQGYTRGVHISFDTSARRSGGWKNASRGEKKKEINRERNVCTAKSSPLLCTMETCWIVGICQTSWQISCFSKMGICKFRGWMGLVSLSSSAIVINLRVEQFEMFWGTSMIHYLDICIRITPKVEFLNLAFQHLKSISFQNCHGRVAKVSYNIRNV